MFFQKSLIAIDIGSSGIKVVEIKRGKLVSMGMELLPDNCLLNGEIIDQSKIVQTLRNLINKLGISTENRRAALSVSGPNVLVKRAVITPQEEDYSEQIYYEAQQQFHIDIHDMIFRYVELDGQNITDDQKAILMIASRKDLIDKKVEIIKSLGMRVGVIDCDLLCIANMFEYNYPIADAVVVVVNVGASFTQVMITYNGEFLFSREIPIGGNEYTAKISSELGMDNEAAESLKLAACMGDQDAIANIQSILSDINDLLVAEIRTSIDFFNQDDATADVFRSTNYIYLSGGASKTLGLDATVAAVLQMPVQIVNPFQKLGQSSDGEHMDYILSQGSMYSVAVGLGLRKYDDI